MTCGSVRSSIHRDARAFFRVTPHQSRTCLHLLVHFCLLVMQQEDCFGRRALRISCSLISGTTAAKEACVTVSGTSVSLESCGADVAALDGHEIWKFTAAGQLASLSESKCLGVPGDVKAGASVKLNGNGQIKLAVGGLCLSQVGPEVGLADVAVSAAATASSTLDSVSHGANLACDGVSSNYWASKLGVVEPVIFGVDFGFS